MGKRANRLVEVRKHSLSVSLLETALVRWPCRVWENAGSAGSSLDTG